MPIEDASCTVWRDDQECPMSQSDPRTYKYNSVDDDAVKWPVCEAQTLRGNAASATSPEATAASSSSPLPATPPATMRQRRLSVLVRI